MELLEIQNFLTIREAKLDVRRFTILIGPQANGKSVVAKLLYFFRNFLDKQFIQSIKNQETKRQLEQQAIAYFEQIFPSYAWSNQAFELSYSNDDVKIFLKRQRRSSKKPNLKFDYSQNLSQLHINTKSLYKRVMEDKEMKSIRSSMEFLIFDKVLAIQIYDGPLKQNFRDSIFIPASRSFFANLQKNVFSLLANNIVIDPLIKEFGSVYESSKAFYNNRFRVSKEEQGFLSLREEVKQEIEKILVGQYIYEDNQDWIISDKRKINLANASSGQQEVLPLLVVLSADKYYIPKVRPSTFFIEEPEAHLFPVSQRRLIGLFSRLYKSVGHNFLLTTHSPYILTALNNLIMASNLDEEKKEKLNGQIKNVIGTDEPIRFEDVGAYTIENGVLESILNQETRLIGSSIIDSVSDEFDRVFDKLMAIELS
ncbi:MAG: AAA family ATPase [Blastocatellia bacterium]